WRDGLLAARAAAISEHSVQLYGRRLLPESARAYYDAAQGHVVKIENRLNSAFYDNFLAKRIQRTNEIFRESVRPSSAGTAAMTGLQLIRLQGEMREYWNALDEGDWEGLAVGFFRNRVPAGTAAEHIVMGNYGLATFDLFATVVPPASLAKMALDVGMEAGTGAWDFYWTSMLEKFTDELYDGATWRVRRTDRLGSDLEVGSWELVAVTYRGQEVRIRDYVAQKQRQIAEMQDAAQLRPAGEQIPFPYEYASQDPLTGWLAGDDILRENLAHQDTILLILDEARKHPAAGWRQQDHVHKVWTARWEQVKLAWMLQTIDELERLKRAAEFGPERFTEAVLKLHEVTDQLRITEQVDDSLAGEGVPPTVMSYLRWLTDATPDAVREFYEMPSADRSWLEATRIVLDALEVYDRVLAARSDAEADFVAPGEPAEDSGLRILTTPYLLAGRPAVDERVTEGWRGLPMAVTTSVHDELDAIKRELGTGNGLDLADGSFDSQTLRGVVYHDTFKEMWKHVQVTTAQVQGSTSNLGYEVWWELWKQSQVGGSEAGHAALDAAHDRLTGADTLEGLGSRDLPLERFRAHDEARDDLVFAFVEHYLLGDDRLTELEERAAALSAEIAGACNTARSEAAAIRVVAESMAAHADDIDATLEALAPALDEAPRELTQVAERHATAETATTEIGDAAVAAEGTSLEICELLRQLRSAATPLDRQSTLDRMQALGDDLDGDAARAETLNADVGRAAEAAAAAFERTSSTLDAVDNVTDAAGDLGDGSTERTRIGAARAELDRARPSLEELENVKAEALDLLERSVRAVQGLPESDRLVALLQQVEARVDRIVAAPDTVAGCPEEAAASLDSAAAQLDGGARALAAARSRLDAFESRVEGLRTELAAAERTVTATEELVSVAEAYLERLHSAIEGADLCLDLARDLAAEAGRMMVPDVVGMAAADAMGVLQQAGFAASLIAGEAAPEPRLAYTVRSQSPGGGEPAADGVAVTLRLWGEAATATVPTVVGLSAADAKAAVEAAGLRAGLVAGEAALTPDLAYVVEHQSPAGGFQVDRGSTVALRILGDFDPAAAVRNVDCSAWPGTEAVWDHQVRAPQCRCPASTRWDGFSQRCVAAAADVQAAA
ncbi:MAG TPA: PASTA domain-containing protein, partial [Candidatus Sulfomarinibacteraceae bacterium]|nr:PASTA domain-containing protein [Candidatus Sulfomarinibacteraceae bacterium]